MRVSYNNFQTLRPGVLGSWATQGSEGKEMLQRRLAFSCQILLHGFRKLLVGEQIFKRRITDCHQSSLQLWIPIWTGPPLWSSNSQGSQPRHWLLLGVLWQRKTRQDKPWGVDQEGGVAQSWQSWNIFLFNLTFPPRVAQTPMSVVSPPTCVLVGHINKLWNV